MNGGGGDVETDLDPWTAWAYKPRTISLLLIGACFLIWASGALDPDSTTSDDLVTSVKRFSFSFCPHHVFFSFFI
jgi:phosphatidylserine synthase 2